MRTRALFLSTAMLAACGSPQTTYLPVDPPKELEEPAPDPGADEGEQMEAKPNPFGYPETRRDELVETVHGVALADPYRWLELRDGDGVGEWMDAQNQVARAHLAALPKREQIAARLKELFYYDAISAPTRRRSRYFYTRRHADKEKSIVYFRAGERGKETVLLDPNTMSEDGSTSLGGYWPSLTGRYVAYALKKNNADAATLYLLDVETGKTLGDEIDGAKYASPSWLPDDSGFYYTALPTDPSIPVAELPGKAEVKFHRLGTDASKDKLIHPATGSAETFIGGYVSRDGKYELVQINHGWNSADLYFRERASKDKTFKPLVVGVDALFSVDVWRDKFYVLTNDGAPRYRVFVVNPKKPARADWKELIPQTESVLDNVSVVGEHLLLQYKRSATSILEVYTLAGKKVREVALPGLGTVSGIAGNPDQDDAYYSFSSFTHPPTIYKTSVAKGGDKEWARIEFPVDTSRMLVEQVWYPSKDGTKISMFIVRNSDTPKNGKNPTLLYGYGGFNVDMLPGFSTSVITWLELGGVYAVPNLRGGGEYGEEWHKAGMGAHKQNVFDDFIAAAKFLVSEGWTSPAQLAIRGGSNGGLLVGAAMTQAPELFAAVICAVPLLDMVRYHLFGSGKTWIPEYGSAEDPAQFKTLHGYSPYHRVVEGTHYPALLMLAADSDDRVDPNHARKFVAAIQHANAAGDEPVLLRIEKNAGHGGADLVKQKVEEMADTYAFILSQTTAP